MKKSRILALMLTGVICVSLFAGGCSLVKVNPEQDKKVEIAVIDGTPLLKKVLIIIWHITKCTLMPVA